jgi:septal ring-binding cell division protein DamX
LTLLNEAAVADYQSGFKAYTHGDIAQALIEWQKVIESPPSDVHPQERAETLYAVAMLYWLGQGVTQDTATSAGFLRQAAELNHAGAQSKLGYLFLVGQGVPANAFEAHKWLEMAARQGDADAQYNLAVMYRDGMGVQANPEIAMGWFEEAAANGDPVSAEVVAEYHRQGSMQTLAAPVEQVSAPQEENQVVTLESVQVDIQEGVEADVQESVQIDVPVVAEQDDAASIEIPITEPSPALEQETTTSASEIYPAEQPPNGLELQHAHSENWILARDPAHYTIQVIALKNLQSMVNLIDAHTGLKPFAVYRQGEPDAPLYVLVQGDYADMEAVRAAQQTFPHSLAKPQQLWVRRFSMVQSLIEQRQQDLFVTSESARGTH